MLQTKGWGGAVEWDETGEFNCHGLPGHIKRHVRYHASVHGTSPNRHSQLRSSVELILGGVYSCAEVALSATTLSLAKMAKPGYKASWVCTGPTLKHGPGRIGGTKPINYNRRGNRSTYEYSINTVGSYSTYTQCNHIHMP